MTREDYIKEFRGRFMAMPAEAFACRNAPPSQIGMLLDRYHAEVRKLLNETFDALCPAPKEAPKPTPDVNGKSPVQPRRTP